MNSREYYARVASVAAPTLSESVIAGVDQDDCAVVDVGGTTLIVSTDFINSSPALIELKVGGDRELGQLAVRHNMADLAGSGAEPVCFMAGVCAPTGTPLNEIIDFCQGVADACALERCAYVGGDTKFGRFKSIYGVAIGRPMAPSAPFLRSAAEPGFVILTSGSIGDFAAAVIVLSQAAPVFTPEEINRARFVLLNGQVPWKAAREVAGATDRAAGTDISDGLGIDLLSMCFSSGVSALVDEDEIPVSQFTSLVADRLSLPPWSLAFASGGDFACLFAVPADIVPGAASSTLRRIGTISQGDPVIRSTRSGRFLPELGHRADRTVPFGEEILFNAREMAAHA